MCLVLCHPPATLVTQAFLLFATLASCYASQPARSDAVCLAGKLIAGAVTDKLGGWLILISVFVIWIVATIGSIFSTSVDMFGYAWLINSFAYTITWGAVVQVIGVTYEAKDRSAVLTLASSGSRFGATLGNIFFGQLLLDRLDLFPHHLLLLLLQIQFLILLVNASLHG